MGVTQFIAQYATAFIGATGYPSVVILMTMESMVFPIPSEAVMPFAGFLIAEGKFSFAGVIGWSTAGSIIGSMLSYYLGLLGGKPVITRWGKYLLLDKHDLEITERFFARRGEIAIFICRFIPVVRHLISLPAGVARMNVAKFAIYTTLGAGVWNAFLAITGFYLKQNWEVVMKYSHVVDIVVVAILVLLLGLFVYRHLLRRRGPAGS